MPRIAKVAAVLALLMAASVMLGAVWGPVVLVPFALIPLWAGIGILRRRVWSAYGFALYVGAQLLHIPLSILFSPGTPQDFISLVVIGIVLAPVFFFAGRSLATAGGVPGRAYPWIGISALALLPFFFVQALNIPSGSMEDTLLVGDHILVQCFPKPHFSRGDIIVFLDPLNHRETYVKRIIGLPGDRIRIADKSVYRNGARLDEPYAVHKTTYTDPYRDTFPSEPNSPLFPPAMDMLEHHVVNGEVVVPDKEYFVLGDNRDASLDSRYFGFVSQNELIGRPLLIYDSEEESGEEALQATPSLRHRQRWQRLFKRL